MKPFSNIQPRYIISITVAIALLMVVSAFFELRQSRQELYHVMEEEALSLAEIIDGSSRNIILTTEQIESQLAARLFNNAYFIARLDSLGLLTNEQLVSFAAANSIFRINIFDKDGKKSLSNYVPHDEHAGLTARHSPMDYIKPILNGDTDRLTIGLKESRFTNEQRFAIAIRRTKRGGGAIVLNLDAADLLEFRKTVGIGKLLRDLGDNSGIEYVALQDPEGIIAASRAVKELSSFDDDALLIPLMQKDTSITRTVTFERRDTYEVLRPLILNNVAVGILRIGLSTEEIRATEERMKRRLGTMSVVLIGLGALVMTAIVANQNYRMTKRKLTAVETFTGSILAHMQDGVVALDAEGKVSLFNKKAQELFGTSEEMMLGKTLDDLLGTTAASLRQLFTVTQNDSELSIRDGNDRERYLSVSVSRTLNEKGTVESTTAVVRDLTEARRLQQEMQRNEKLSAMGELASGVAHEIRNPLNAIAMIAQRYESEFVPQEGAPEYLSLTKVLKSEVQRVNGIIRQFLGFARPPKLTLQEVHSTELVHRVATLFDGQARAKGIQFTVTNACDVNLRCDFEQMTQALLNLLQNALDATSRGGAIDLHCSVNGQRVQFSVKDSGVGIPKERLDKIFNLYYSTKPDGTGLGLAITHQIASQHEGSIEVESKEGNGSRFIVSLPRNNT